VEALFGQLFVCSNDVAGGSIGAKGFESELFRTVSEDMLFQQTRGFFIFLVWCELDLVSIFHRTLLN
jgi:hypothetical protein